MKKILGTSALALLLITGCGGGSSSDKIEETVSDTVQDAIDDTQDSVSEAVDNAVDDVKDTVNDIADDVTSESIDNADYIKGVYNIAVSEDGGTSIDEAFLVISKDGTITTYDYQADSVNNGENCYIKNPTNLNASLNGTKVTNDETNKLFNSGEYNWVYDSNTEIIKVNYGGYISAGGILNLNNTRIATSKWKVDSPSVDDMEQLLCQ